MRATARLLLDFSHTEGTVLVAVSPRVAHGTGAGALAAGLSWGGSWGVELSKGDLFVQIATGGQAARERILADVERALADLTVTRRVRTARLRENREPFGFVDGKVPSAADIAAVVVDEGPARGCSCILWMACRQNVAGFKKLPLAERQAVMGVDLQGHPLPHPSKQAHVPRFAAARLPMVRRSLPFEDQRGLAFVAAAARPETLVSALDLLGQDSLSAWMTPEDVSLFIALPAGNVLDAAEQPPVDPAFKENRMTYGKDPQLITYPQSVAMLEYILKAKELGAFEGPIGDMKINPHLEPVLRALHVVLAGGSVEVKEVQRGNPELIHRLDELLSRAAADNNEINKKSGYYVTAVI